MKMALALAIALVLSQPAASFVRPVRPNLASTTRSAVKSSPLNFFERILLPSPLPSFPAARPTSSPARTTAQAWVGAYNAGDVKALVKLLADDCIYEDFSFNQVCQGPPQVERRLRLQQQAGQWSPVTIGDWVVDDPQQRVGLLFTQNDRFGCAWMELTSDSGLIQRLEVVMEPEVRKGQDNLQLLSTASKIIEVIGVNPSIQSTTASPSATKTGASPAERYFAAWSRRDMEAAIQVFADEVEYEDTAFPGSFQGKQALYDHLMVCADAFPASFTFEVDELVDGGDQLLARWHVESNGKPMPYTRGLSIYRLNRAGLIEKGIDFVEPPGPIKAGGPALFLESMKGLIAQEPVRIVAIAAWIAYMYIVFFSDGILPGANAFSLEERTWKEVLDLSLNFFLVSPLLGLPFSPSVHPMLEGVFNLLLSWAAMFAGFLSDDRRDKPNLIPMLPIVVGMQFLTSAFLLPYLATRTPERRTNVTQQDLSVVAQVCESRLLGPAMATVGTASIVWFFVGRLAEYGGLAARWTSFLELLSIDRVGSSFIVDLAIFGLFQSWLIDNDLQRRGVVDTNTPLARAAKYVPFFGMAAYLTLRPSLADKEVI